MIKKSFKKNKIVLLMLFTFLILCSINTFAGGPGDIKGEKIAVVGDSYAAHFKTHEGEEEFSYYVFPVGTITKEINIEKFEEAINSSSRCILFATGVNDQALATELCVFEDILRNYISKIKTYGKYLFFHTYMDFPIVNLGKGKYKPKDYDAILRKLANEFDNVIYIDMSGFVGSRYCISDGMHFNKYFYDSLRAKLMYYIEGIANTFSSLDVDWVKLSNNNKIAVAGDIHAYDFYTCENEKKYKLLNFANKDVTLKQNIEYILGAIDSDASNILISLKSADYEAQTDVYDFMDSLRECLNVACYKNKKVFLHTYTGNTSVSLPNPISSYDMVIRVVAEEYPNACYIDLRSVEAEKPVFQDMLYNSIDMVISG